MLSLFFYKNKNILVFICLIIFSIFSISTYSIKTESFLNRIFYIIVSPLTWARSEVDIFIQSTFRDVKNISFQLREIKKLDELNKKFELMKVENYKLKKFINELLAIKSQKKYLNSLFENDLLGAQIVMRKFNNHVLSLIINKGEYHGIKENMPVIAFQRVHENNKIVMKLLVVGKIVNSTYFHSKILPITDPECLIHAKVIVKDSKGNLMPKWLTSGKGFIQGRGNYLKRILLTQLPRSLPIQIGDEVVTTGGQSIFQRGIKIGKIVKNISNSFGFMSEVLVQPYVNYIDLNTVLIVKKKLHPEIRRLMDNVK